METRVIQIELIDGRTFRVFCANRTQINKTLNQCKKLPVKLITELTNGLHNTSDFIEITNEIYNK